MSLTEEAAMPRTRQDTWAYCHQWTRGWGYGPGRFSTREQALRAWANDSADDPDWPRYGLCILDEVNHIAYIRPDHPNSIANPEKMTRRMLKASGRMKEAEWEIKEMEEET